MLHPVAYPTMQEYSISIDIQRPRAEVFLVLPALQAFDLNKRTLSFQSQNGSGGTAQQLHYDLLIGADGVSSQVRR